MRTFQIVAAAAAAMAIASGLAHPLSVHADEPQPHHRQLPPPRVLWITEVRTHEPLAELLRHDLPADITILPWSLDHLDFHHLGDNPVHQSDADKKFAAARLDARLHEVTTNLEQFDVVMLGFNNSPIMGRAGFSRYEMFGERIANWVRHRGGKLVYMGQVPEPDASGRSWSLAEVLPVKPGRHMRWTNASLGAGDHPLLRGLPFEIVDYHFYGRLLERIDDTCAPLTRSERFEHTNWHRAFEDGGQSVFFLPVLGRTTTPNERGPDRWAIWSDIFQRLIYGLTYGDAAYPAATKIMLGKVEAAVAGTDLKLKVDVENRSERDAQWHLRLELISLATGQRRQVEQAIALPVGTRNQVTFTLPFDLPCVDEYVQLRAIVLDQSRNLVLGESQAFLPYIHTLPLTIAADRVGYQPGEKMTIRVTSPPPAQAGQYQLAVARVDRQGRVMEISKQQMNLVSDVPLDAHVAMTMPDWDPELAASIWLNATIRPMDSDVASGSVWTKVFNDRRWDMRQQMQFSVWSRSDFQSLVRLQQDAGFNALGYPGNNTVADRYGMRQYVEGTGVDTMRVQINQDSWDKVETTIAQRFAALQDRGPGHRSQVIVSLGEEAGFGQGWGRRYYWDEESAPPAAQKMFAHYLAERYDHDIQALNQQWMTRFKSFDEVPLLKRLTLSKYANRVHLANQSWMSMDNPDETAPATGDDPVESDSRYLGVLAPYYETYNFFDDYYQRYCDLVTKHYRARNPVGLTSISLSSGRLEPATDIPTYTAQGPHYWPEMNLVTNAIARRDYGNHPAFAGVFWAYFDLPSLWGTAVRSHLLAGNTHLDYWVDIPLTFNGDLTHTRSSMWTRQLTRQIRPIEPILLHQRFYTTPGLAMYVPLQPLPNGREGTQFGYARNPNAALYGALTNTGHFPRVTHLHDMADTQVLFASHAQVVSPRDGAALRTFVENGGLLVTDPMIASCNRHGNMFRVYPDPDSGVAELLGFRLNNTSQPRSYVSLQVDLHEHFPLAGPLELMSFGRDEVIELADDVEVLARHGDGQPLLLRRRVGKGTVLHFNIVFDFGKSTFSMQREGFHQLIAAVLRQDGRVRPAVRVGFQSMTRTSANNAWRPMDTFGVPADGIPAGSTVPWWSTQLYTDPSGHTTYFAVFTHHISPVITADVAFDDPDSRIVDLFTGQPIQSHDGRATLTLRPGDAAYWAVTRRTPGVVTVQAPEQLDAGRPLPLKLAVAGGGSEVRGMIVDVYDPTGQRSRAHSLTNVQVGPDGANVHIPTALNDSVGEWRLVVIDSITRQQLETRVTLKNAGPVATLNPLVPNRHDTWTTADMTTRRFLECFRQLRDVYEGEHESLRAKYMLSFFLHVPFEPLSRHQLVRQLHRTDWQPHIASLAEAISDGERFILLGEDLNVDPTTNQPIDVFASADPHAAIRTLIKDHQGKRHGITHDGFSFERIRIGKGELIVCHASVDALAYTSREFVQWHKRLRAALDSLRMQQ